MSTLDNEKPFTVFQQDENGIGNVMPMLDSILTSLAIFFVLLLLLIDVVHHNAIAHFLGAFGAFDWLM